MKNLNKEVKANYGRYLYEIFKVCKSKIIYYLIANHTHLDITFWTFVEEYIALDVRGLMLQPINYRIKGYPPCLY